MCVYRYIYLCMYIDIYLIYLSIYLSSFMHCNVPDIGKKNNDQNRQSLGLHRTYSFPFSTTFNEFPLVTC